MAQPQPVQRNWYRTALRQDAYLEQVPELQPEVLQSSGPGIGSEDPEPAPTDTFQPNDVF